METASTFVRNAAILYGPHLELVEGASLFLDGGRIYGPAPGGAPRGSDEVDGDGLLLVPGFVDAHVHIGFADPAEVLRRGVTTVRDLGWPEEAIFPLARASRSPSFDGPLILAAGPILTAPGGYPTRAAWAPPGTGREIAGPDEAVAAVRHLVAAGAWSIKFSLNPPVGPVLDRETLAAVVTAAHETAETKVTGHVYGKAELDKAVSAGADELAHMLMSEEELDAEAVRRLVAAGMTIVPTLSVRFGSDRDVAIANLARFRQAGGRVVYGTDLGNEGPGPGIDRTEIRAMAEAGFDTAAIVAAATVTAAEHLGLDHKGVIESVDDRGRRKDADVVAVPLDALEDPEKLSDVKMVWRGGRRVV